eukprot:TRINITY_DN10321_c0_g1_i1.p1 TRINITY_DN10321_c0_g1~~TRINITY_DN10321_c0_g1_i1.p1  ORF type:complete len:163 (+),score=12.75 TRINITY_DN10321_c0_g1_i1:64-552(+)
MCIRDRSKFRWTIHQNWKFLNQLIMIPINIIAIYKIFRPVDTSKFTRANQFPLLLPDKLLWLYVFSIGFYSTLDLLARLLLGHAFINFCNVIFTFDIIFLLLVIYLAYFVNYIPGEAYLAWTFYSLLIGTGETRFVLSIYFILMILCQNSCLLYTSPSPRDS